MSNFPVGLIPTDKSIQSVLEEIHKYYNLDESAQNIAASVLFKETDKSYVYINQGDYHKVVNLYSVMDKTESLVLDNRIVDIIGYAERNYSHISWDKCYWDEYEFELFFPYGSANNWFFVIHDSAEIARAVKDKIIAFFNSEKPKIQVFQNQSFSESKEMKEAIEGVKWNDVVLPPEQLDDLISTVSSFFENKNVYHSLNVAWRRGILLKGVPGTGKTQFCKAAVNEMDVPALYVKNLDGYGSSLEAISIIFERARLVAPCILIMEDLDSIIDDSMRSTFLNELDGFYKNEGILIIASTNHAEKIDEALVKRPSRFDRVITVRIPKFAERSKYIRLFLNKSNGADSIEKIYGLDHFVEVVAKKTDGFTLAHIKECFVGVALEYAHRGNSDIDSEYLENIEKNIRKIKTDMNEVDSSDKSASGKGSAGFGFSPSDS